MAKYYVTSPEGVNYELDGPEGATQEQAIAVAQQLKAQGKLREVKSAGFSAADTGIQALQGVVGAGKSVAQFFGADNAAAEYLGEKQKSLQSAISPERQAEMARRQAIEKRADESGKGELSAYLGGIAEAPLQSLAQGLGSAAPALIAAGVTLVAGAPAALVGAVGFATKYLLGAIQGAGEVKGSIYDATYEALRKQGKSEEDAKRQAVEAQSYLGKNTDNILVGTGLGVLAGGTGLEGALFKGVGSKLGKKAIEEGEKQAEKGLLRRGLTEGVKEALPEGAQGGQERYAQNVALTREGFETPALQGVLGSAARDAAVGAMTGAAISPLTRGYKPPEAAVPPGTPGAPTPIEQRRTEVAEAAAAAQAKAEAVAQAKIEKAAAKADAKAAATEAKTQAGIDTANAAVPEGGNLDIFGAPPARKRATQQTDLFGNPVVPTAVEEEGEPTTVAQAAQEPTTEEQGAQQSIPGLETFPVSHLINQGVPKNSAMVRAYASEGTNAVDLSDPKAVETLIGRLNGWIKASKGNPKPEIQNAVKEFSSVLPMLRQHLESLTPTTQEAPSAKPIVKPASGEGVSVAGEPDTGAAPGGVSTPDTSGVVSTEPDVGQPPTGEGQQPTAIEEVPPTAETPVAETPVAETPVAETPVAETPVAETPVAETSLETARAKFLAASDVVDKASNALEAAREADLSISPTATKKARKAAFDNLEKAKKDFAKATANSDAAFEEFQKFDETGGEPTRVYGGGDVEPFVETPAKPAPFTAPDIGTVSVRHAAPPTKRKIVGANSKVDTLEDKLADLEVDEDLNKGKVKAFAGKLLKSGVISQRTMDTLNSFIADRDMGPQDLIDELKLALAEHRDTGKPAKIFEVGANPPASPKFVTAITEGNIRKALQGIIQDPKTHPLTKFVAQRIIQSKMLPRVQVVPANSLGVNPTDSDFYRAGEYNAENDTVYIDERNVDAPTVIHEIVHSFLHQKISEYVHGGRADAQVKRIDDLFQYLTANYPELAEQYGMADLSEFASEAMSNKAFQDKLKAIPYKKGNFFSEFAKAVLRVLGITDKNPSWNALAEALISVENAMQSGRTMQEARTGMPMRVGSATPSLIATPANVAAAQQANIVNVSGPPSVSSRVQQMITGGSVDKFRKAFADKFVTLDNKLFAGYGGRIKDTFGNLNPSVLLAQALDFLRVAEHSLLLGGLEKTVDGSYTATDLTVNPNGTGGPANMQEVFKIIAADAKAQNTTYKKVLHSLGTMLVGHRENELRAYNALPTTIDPITLGLTDAEITDFERRFQASASAKKILEIMDAMRFNRIDKMVEAGRITPAKAQAWKDNSAYIPFDRIEESFVDAMKKGTGAAKGLAGVASYRKLKGSTLQVGDPVKAFMDQIVRMTGDTMRVNAVSKALQDLELLGYARRVRSPVNPTPSQSKQYVETYINGAKTTFFLDDPLDAAAFAGMPTDVPDILKGMQKFTQVLRAGVTLMPGFALGQLMQDTVRAYAFSDVMKPAALIPRILMNYPVVAFGELTGRKGAIVRRMENLGIAGAYDTTTHTTIKNILLSEGIEKRNPIQAIMHIGESLSKASDLAVRKAIFEQTLKETGGNEALAETRAREIINFSRRGDSNTLNFLTRTVPFIGAYTRGLDKLYTAATGQGHAYGLTRNQARNIFIKRMATLTALGVAYAFMMAGNDDYEKEPDHVRDSNIILPGAKTLGFLPVIPMPKDLAFVFLAMPQRLVQYMRKNGTPEEQNGVRIIGELMRQGLGTILSPNVTPVALRPIIENIANYSFFMDRALESQSQLAKESFQRYGTSTSDTAKATSKGLYDVSQSLQNMGFSKGVAGAVEMSPIKLENLFRGILGTSAELMLGMGDMMINPSRTDRPLHKTLLPMVTGLSALMKDPVGKRQLEDMHELYNETSAAKNTYDSLLKSDPLQADEYAKDHLAEIQINPYVKGLMDEINKHSQIARMIDTDTSIKSDERYRIISGITREQNLLSSDVDTLRSVMLKERQALNP